MNQDDLKAITTIVASPAFTEDRLWLNGVCVAVRWSRGHYEHGVTAAL